MHRRQLLTALAAGATAVPALALGATRQAVPASLPVEGDMPSLAGATGWIGTPPLTTAGLRGKVVLVQFWTYSCINWLRTMPYVRAWAEAYRDHGLVVIGVHTPEFSFEKNVGLIRQAVRDMKVAHAVAIDSDDEIWRAFDNRYWPALYLVDPKGRIRYHHFGEGRYAETEAALGQLLTEGSSGAVLPQSPRPEPQGFEAQADWADLQSAETYVGHARGENLASHGGVVRDRRHLYDVPAGLRLGQWSLAGEWTIESELARLNSPKGRLAMRFHARDLHLVMGPGTSGSPLRFRLLLDGRPPAADHGLDVDGDGRGTVARPRLYQLVRQRGAITDREISIEFLEPGVEAYSFTFG